MISTRFKQTRAFTLIELMIVIAIIAILAGIMVPNFMRARAESQLSACEQNLKTIATAAEMYLVRNKLASTGSDNTIACDVGMSVGKIDGLIAADSHEHEGVCLDIDDLVDGKYLNKAPICPAAGNSTYVVECGHKNNTFTVYCSGSNHTACQIPADYPKYSSISGIIER